MLDAELLGCRDKDVHLVGAVFQDKESGAAGNDAGSFVGNGIEDFLFGFENVVYGYVLLVFTGERVAP